MPHQSEKQALKSREAFFKRYETSSGKNDLLRTWMEQEKDIQDANHEYLVGLTKRIRAQRNLLMHMRPQADEKKT